MQVTIKGTDSRTPIQRLHRYDLWRVAKEHAIPFPVGAPAEQMIQLIESSGIDVTKPLPQSGKELFRPVMVEYEQGKFRQDAIPVVEPIATASMGIDYDAVMERAKQLRDAQERADKEESRADDLEAKLKAALAKLDALEKVVTGRAHRAYKVPMEKRNVMTLRKMCRDLGIHLEPHEQRDRLYMIAALRKAEDQADGQDAT